MNQRLSWAARQVNRRLSWAFSQSIFDGRRTFLFLTTRARVGSLVDSLFCEHRYSTSNMEDGDSDEPADATMTTISRHVFEDDAGESVFSVSIIENMKEDYGLFVWPCSIVLAEYVWQQKTRFAGANVVELGAGTSLPGLVAAKLGADVTLTDDANRVEVLENIRRVCDLNNLNCNVLGLTWGVWDKSIFCLRPTIIIGADVLYENSAFDDLLATVAFLLQSSPGSVFITTYHNRSGHHLIEFLMVKWGLKCEKLLDGYAFMPSHKASRLRGNIQLAKIVLSRDPVKVAKCV